jgi:acetylornithine deacetylase
MIPPSPAGAVDVQALLDLMDRVLRFDTTSSRSNLDFLAWVADHARPFGPSVRYTYNDSRTKANLLLSFGPATEGGVILSAHSDTVPVAGQDWHVPPFQATVRDGKVHGRGASDMKGFIVACLAALPGLHAQGLERPVHLALSYDEEYGCIGAPRMLDDIRDHVPAPAFVWVGEPTDMHIATAHKGACVFETEFFGRDAHSSMPHLGHSAVADAARFAAFLLDLGVQAAERRTAVPGLVPAHTTFNIGLLEGGSALNMVARRCRMTWEFRPIPEEDAGVLRDRIEDYLRRHARSLLPREATLGEAGDVRHDASIYVPPLHPGRNRLALQALRTLLGDKAEIAVPFGTEAGQFQDRGWPAVVCGPGSIAQAHQPDEWVSIAQLRECAGAIAQLPAYFRKDLHG